MFGFLAPIFGALGGKAAVGAVAKTVAGSLVSGAIASKQQKKNLAFQQAQSDQNEERHSDRFVDLVENAQRAGFNPLTALRADGASAYQAPILNAPMSSSTFIGNALVDGMNTGFNYDQQKRDEERDNLERDIMKAQLDQLQKANKVRGGEYFGYGIPNARTTTDNSGAPSAQTITDVLGHTVNSEENSYHSWARNEDGELVRVINNQVAEPEQALMVGMYKVRDAWVKASKERALRNKDRRAYSALPEVYPQANLWGRKFNPNLSTAQFPKLAPKPKQYSGRAPLKAKPYWAY